MHSGMNEDLYPNIRWLPSRSANPREEHRHYYGLVLPKNHPFWKENQPGNLWNCKCDWEETSRKPTRAPDESAWAKPDRGLGGNPGVDGELFSRDSSYYKTSAELKAEIEAVLKPIETGVKEYVKYTKDSSYRNVYFNWDNGGMKATHMGHNFDPEKGYYEIDVQNLGYENGYKVVLGNELTEAKHNEGTWNEVAFEQRGCENGSNPNNVMNGLVHAAEKPGARIAVLYFPNNDFNKDVFRQGLSKYYYYGQELGQKSFREFDDIVVICNGKIEYFKCKKPGI
jgi:hypothetical protein